MAPGGSLVVATFPEATTATAAVDRLTRTGLTRDRIHWNDPRPTDRLLVAQQHESEHLNPALSVGVITDRQARGAFGLAAVGALVGAVLGTALAALPFLDGFSLLARLLIGSACGAVALSAAAFVYGGALGTRTHDRLQWTRVQLDVEAASPEDATVLADHLLASRADSVDIYLTAPEEELSSVPGDPSSGAV